MAAIEAGLKGQDANHRQACARLLGELADSVLDHPSVALLVVDALLNWDPRVREISSRTLRCWGPSKLARSPEVMCLLDLVRQHGPGDVRDMVDVVQSAS